MNFGGLQLVLQDTRPVLSLHTEDRALQADEGTNTVRSGDAMSHALDPELADVIAVLPPLASRPPARGYQSKWIERPCFHCMMGASQ
jgi:hypothetical protein